MMTAIVRRFCPMRTPPREGHAGLSALQSTNAAVHYVLHVRFQQQPGMGAATPTC